MKPLAPIQRANIKYNISPNQMNINPNNKDLFISFHNTDTFPSFNKKFTRDIKNTILIDKINPQNQIQK